MANTDYSEAFIRDAADKQFTISYRGGALTNENICDESMTLKEILCGEQQLRFGSCNASCLEMTIINNAAPLKNECITVSCNIEGMEITPYRFGVYKVHSDKPTADRRYRDIVAYDAMYDILNADVADWYNTILPNADSTVTIKEFRDSFITYFGLEQEEVTLVNDSMIVAKTVEPSQMSGKTVITAICEINGCFGHIGRNGKFQYIHLKEMSDGLYPSNTLYPRDDLYPADPRNAEQISKNHYINAEYEDFTTEKISKLQIRQEENDIGCIYGTGDNCYIVQDNFLVYGKSSDELQTIAEKLYSVISRVWYRPAHVEAKGNPCLEVGDGIRLSTKYAIVYTYILQRTLKGIQALRDTYEADGEQYQSEKVNSVNDSIIQLKGKTNKLTRTIEETRLEIRDIEAGLESKITQTAQKIETEVTRAKSAEESLGSRITQTAESISSEVTRATNAESNLSSKINQTADSISAEVQRAMEAEGTLSSKITQTAESISSEVTRATNAESNLSSKINQTADQIELKVSKGDVSSQLSIESGQVTLKSNRFVLESTNCSISKEGNIKASNVDLSGKITASSGKIGGFSIGSNSIYTSTASSLGGVGVYVGTDGLSCASSTVSSVIKSDGSAEFKTSDGIKVWSSTSNYAYVKPGGITIKNSTYTDTTYSEKSINCYSTFTINAYGGLTIDATSTGTRNVKILAGSLTYADFETTTSYLYGGSTGLSVGRSGSKLGFFGSTGDSKKSITSISSTSSATASTNAAKINEILTALKAYNLIG